MTSGATGAGRIDQQRLLEAARNGDEEAFRWLVAPYRRALEVHCYRMLGSTQDSEDLAQETLLRAWRALDRFEPRAQFQTWLYRIATNACLDEIERRSRRPEPVDPLPESRGDEAAAPAYDPAARYAIREGVELALLHAMQQLPGRQRAALVFRDVLGWSAPETAEVLDATVASVNSALQRARKTIDELLPADLPSAPDPAERELLARYVAAFETDDIDELVRLLREDALLKMPPQPDLLGGLEIARFFHDTIARGNLTRIRHTATWANGRPAVTIHVETEDGRLIPHGISVLEVRDGQIAVIDAFLNPGLVARFAPPMSDEFQRPRPLDE
jgi:RNA polymerase sigma-70 factor (ECF subfamily)